MSCSQDVDSLQFVGQIVGDRQSVPGIQRAVHEEDVGGSVWVISPVVIIGAIDIGQEVEVEDILAHIGVELERNHAAEGLIRRVCGLEVSKLGACID